MGYRKLAKIRKSMQIRKPFVQKINFKKFLNFLLLVKWLYHKLYFFQFPIFDTNWPSLIQYKYIDKMAPRKFSLILENFVWTRARKKEKMSLSYFFCFNIYCLSQNEANLMKQTSHQFMGCQILQFHNSKWKNLMKVKMRLFVIFYAEDFRWSIWAIPALFCIYFRSFKA